MGRVSEVADIVTWLLTEPGADERRLDRIAAILAHSDTTRHAGVRAALDATRSAMADPAFDDSRSGRLCARLERLTADSPPTASDVAALRLLLDPTGSPERPTDLSVAVPAPPPEAVIPAQPAPPAAEMYRPPAEDDHAQWLAGLASAPAAAPLSAAAPQMRAGIEVRPEGAIEHPPAAAPPPAGDAGWAHPYAGTAPTEEPAARHAYQSPDLTDGSPVPGAGSVSWPESPTDVAPWSAPLTDGSPASGAASVSWPESPTEVAPPSTPHTDTSSAPQAVGATWPDSPVDVTPTPAAPADDRRQAGVPGAPDRRWAADLAGGSEAPPAPEAGWPANHGGAISTPVTDAHSRWAPDAAGTHTPRTGEFEWSESLSDDRLSMPAAGADHARWAPPDAAGPPSTPHAGNTRWPENHRGVTATPTTDPGDPRSPATPFLPRDGLSRWPVNPTGAVPLSGPAPDSVNSRWPDDLAGRVAPSTKDNGGGAAWSDFNAAFPPPEAEGTIARGPLAEDPIDPDRPPGSAEREPWVR